MSCTGVPTGGEYSSFGRTRVCVNLSEPDTLREVKSALRVLSGLTLRLDSPLWTPADEAALQVWSTDESVSSHDVMREGPLGWMVPSGEGIELMVQHLRWTGAHTSFPLLEAAVQSAESHWLGAVDTSDPVIGSGSSTASEAELEDPPSVLDRPDEPSADTTELVFPVSPRPATEQSNSTPSYRNAGLLVAAVGILAAFAYYMRG